MIRQLFNNRVFVISLAACAGLYMVYSITAPMLDEPDFSQVEAPAFAPEEVTAALEVVATAPAQRDQEQEIWRADQSVLLRPVDLERTTGAGSVCRSPNPGGEARGGCPAGCAAGCEHRGTQAGCPGGWAQFSVCSVE